MKRIGIDVGGTNTDAVFVADGRMQAVVKLRRPQTSTTAFWQRYGSYSTRRPTLPRRMQ